MFLVQASSSGVQSVVPETEAEAMEEDGAGLEEDAVEADARRKAAAKAAEAAELRKRSQVLSDLSQDAAAMRPLSSSQHAPSRGRLHMSSVDVICILILHLGCLTIPGGAIRL